MRLWDLRREVLVGVKGNLDSRVTKTRDGHTHARTHVCVFVGGGDKKEHEVGQGHVYSKLLFRLQIPVP